MTRDAGAPHGLLSDAEAGITWMSGTIDARRIALPALGAALGVACVAFADTAARNGASGMMPLWWVGVLAIFMPAAAVLFYSRLSRNEAVTILLLVGLALYCVKLLYSPGALWGYDELLHYRTLDNLITSHRLFSPNSLLPVSPFYPGMESVIASITLVTGLTEIQAGLVLIGVVRLLSVLAIFLLLERIASPSRFAAPATLLYMTCPAFLYFDSMMSYESLALALALVTLFVLAAAQNEQGARRQRLNAVGAVLTLAVITTHHVTSFILVGALVTWVIFQVIYTFLARRRASATSPGEARDKRRRVYVSDLPGSLWVPLLAVLATALWLFNVAEVAISYLMPQVLSGVTEMMGMIFRHTAGRQLFQSTIGHTSPLLERLTGLGSVALILLLIPVSMKYLWERRHSSVLSHFFALGALGYPAILALRLTRSGWAVGSRATAFVYLPLAFTVAAGLELLIARRFKGNRLLSALVLVAVGVIFAGGIIAGTSPSTRMPSPYNPGAAEVPYDTESLSAANWAATTLGANNRIVADSAQAALMGSIGRQDAVSSEGTMSVSQLFLSPEFDQADRNILKAGAIDYVVVDQRIAGDEPLKGYVYEPWERLVIAYGTSVSTDTVGKFDDVRDASRVFDSGNVRLFGVHRLVASE